MGLILCNICNKKYDKQSGYFTRHLKEVHNMSLRDYVVKTEYNNIAPKCQCIYCNEDAPFNSRKWNFYSHIKEHTTHKWLNTQWILKNGIPTCEKCGNTVKWTRGKPNKYCSSKCQDNNWNQEKIKKTVNSRYGVDSVLQIPEVIEKIQKQLNHKEIAKKGLKTLEKRGIKSFNPEKAKKTFLERYGVDHYSKTKKFREIASKTFIEINKNLFNIKKYKDTELYYQSLYELDFINICKSHNLLYKLKNGNTYKYLNEDTQYGTRILTDFSIDNYEIEVKSYYILEKQGGISVLNAKRRAVESTGKQYIVILKKDYTEFNSILKELKHETIN